MNDPQHAAVCPRCGKPYATFGETEPGAGPQDCYPCFCATRAFFERPLRFGESGLLVEPAKEDAA